jgi:hypothetical protein
MVVRTVRSSMSTIAVAIALVGCGEGEVPIGEASAKALIGKWDGYIENFHFDSGSDAISIVVQSGEGTEFAGTVQLGNQPLLAPPTVAESMYPPLSALESPLYAEVTAIEGFEYTLLDGVLTDTRMRFGLRQTEVWQAWCELQTPVLEQAPDGYGCLPNWGYNIGEDACSQLDPASGLEVARDCGQLTLCQKLHICECTSEQCGARSGVSHTFDLVVDENRADGSGTFGNMHLARAE